MNTDDFEGKGSVCILQPEENCPNCNQKSVHYIGSSVVCDAPYVPTTDTEVEFFYLCKMCDNEWGMYA